MMINNKQLLYELTLLNLNPRLFISHYFDDLVNQIDLNAEIILFNQNNSDNDEEIVRSVNAIREKQIDELKLQEKSYQERLQFSDYAFKTEVERNWNLERFESLRSTTIPAAAAEIEREVNRMKRAYLENRTYSFIKLNGDADDDGQKTMSILLKFDNFYQNDCELECIRKLARIKADEFIDFEDKQLLNREFKMRLFELILFSLNEIDDQGNEIKEITLTKNILDIYLIVNHLIKFKQQHRSISTQTDSCFMFTFKEEANKLFAFLNDDKLGTEIAASMNELELKSTSRGIKIKQIESEAFIHFHHLSIFSIQGCLIEHIDRYWFISAGNSLTRLWLDNNRIKKIRSNDLMHLNRLKDLSLSSNLIDEIEPDAFKWLSSSLIELDLSANRLKSISINNNSWGLFDAAISTLNLSRNQIVSISETETAESYSSELRFLDLSGNRIEAIDLNAFQLLKELKQLFLHDNQIRHLHDGQFTNQSKLIDLDLSDNRIEHLTPIKFKGLHELEWLNLFSNLIKLNIKKNDLLIDSKESTILLIDD